MPPHLSRILHRYPSSPAHTRWVIRTSNLKIRLKPLTLLPGVGNHTPDPLIVVLLLPTIYSVDTSHDGVAVAMAMLQM